MAKILRLLILACCCCFLSGCFELKQTLVFQSADSCVISWNYRFPEVYAPALLQYEKGLEQEQKNDGRLPWLMVLNRPVLEKWLKKQPDLELQNYSSYAVDGQRKVQIVIACSRAMKNLNRGIFGDITLKKNALGDVSCTVALPPFLKMPAEEKAFPVRALQGMKLNYIISVPTALLQTNGRKDSFRSASWNWDFSQQPPLIPQTGKLEFSW